ncbi:hypothetical protein LDENG_00162350 [Lucifuga dentata]|nr:hypothetical protein LDENG_00162350 [Lucifuga dentata]
MERRYALVFMCLIIPLCLTDANLSNRVVLEPFDFLFDAAVDAYYKSDWLSVILNMEKALKNKAAVRRVKAECRLSCANRTAFGEPMNGLGVPIPGAGAVEDLGFFQRILKRADCVNSCEIEKLGPPTVHQVSEELELEFKKRTPYNYLQVAYFKGREFGGVQEKSAKKSAWWSVEAEPHGMGLHELVRGGELQFIDEIMNADSYCQILEEKMLLL